MTERRSLEPAEWQVNDLGQLRGLYTADQILALVEELRADPNTAYVHAREGGWNDALSALLRELGMEDG